MLVHIQSSSDFEAGEETKCSIGILTNMCCPRLQPHFVPWLQLHYRHVTRREAICSGSVHMKSAMRDSVHHQIRMKGFTRICHNGPIKDVDPRLLAGEYSRFRIIRPALVQMNFVKHDLVVVGKVLNILAQLRMECKFSPFYWFAL